MGSLKYTHLIKCICLFLLASCAYQPSKKITDKVYSPSDAVSNAEALDGKFISVRGYVSVSPSGMNIFDIEDKDRYINKGACLGLDLSDHTYNKLQGARTRTIKGIFRKNLCGKDDICLYWCIPYGLEVSGSDKAL